ncbi:MAG: universal stress protein [Caldimicrobium sp.]
MKKFYKSFEELIVASSFAEEGEFEAARQILKGKRRVLLVIEERGISQKAMLYAINVCKRTGTGLDILFISQGEEYSKEVEELIQSIKEEGIDIHLVMRKGNIREEILKYIKEKKNIDFIVIETGQNFKDEERMNDLAHFWSQVKCPVVWVEG